MEATTTAPSSVRHTISNRVQSKQESIIPWLQKFYNEPGRIETLLKVLSPETKVSLRLIDWFVTNYSKKYNTTFMLGATPFPVHFQYKRELKAYSKRFFDPFCRRDRIEFSVRGQAALTNTTIGQLNFFRWAIDKQVIDYILAHSEEIEADMNNSFRDHYKKEEGEGAGGEGVKSSTGRRKRKEMSKTITRHVTHYSTPVVVSFD